MKQLFDISHLIGTKNGPKKLIRELKPRIYSNENTIWDRNLRMVEVECDCGNVHEVRLNYFKNRKLKNKKCSCHLSSGRRKTGEPEFQVYYGMIQRCYNKKHQHFHNYGGRGIIVCDRWLGFNGYENFKKDMGPRPTLNHSVDRIEVNGIYKPDNCRWALPDVQSRNRRNVRTDFIPGYRKDRLLILEELDPIKISDDSTTSNRMVRVKCDCGVIKDIKMLSLDVISSCGCLNQEVREIKHIHFKEGDMIKDFKIIREATIEDNVKDIKRRYYVCSKNGKERIVRLDRLRIMSGHKRTPKVKIPKVKRKVKHYRTIYKNHYGVKLRRGYVIHHIDGNRKNNKIKNLIEIPKYSHMWIHKKDNLHLIGMDKELLKLELIKNFPDIVL